MAKLDAETKDLLRRLAAHLSGRQGKDAKALGRRLEAAVQKGEVAAGEFTVGDTNIIQQNINTAEFMAQVLAEVAQQPPSPATKGASDEAAKARAQPERLKKYRDAVAGLMKGS